MMFCSQTKFHPHLLHKVTVFFNPKQRSMKVLPSASKDEVLAHIRQQLAQLSEETATTATQEEQPPAKRRRIVDEFDDEPISQVDSDEVTLYQTCQVGEHEGILQWWKNNKQHYPRHMSVLSYVHKLAGMPDPAQHFIIKKLLAGAQKLSGKPDTRLPISLLSYIILSIQPSLLSPLHICAICCKVCFCWHFMHFSA